MAACYHISGQVSRQMAPCNHTAVAEGKHTSCCTENYLCLSNGMCRSANLSSVTNYYWRIGCTDKTFTDPACGRYCAQGGGSYCCNTGKQTPYEERVGRTNTSCCDIKDLLFKAPDPIVVATASFIGQLFSIGTSMASAFSPPMPSVSSISTGASMIPSPSAEASQPSTDSTSKSVALSVGLGVGLGVGAVMVMCVGLVCVRRRKRQHDDHGEGRKRAPVELMATGPSETMTVERPVELMTPSVKSSKFDESRRDW
ncbi:hypothetical protein BKA63DRAFT_555928 [Paraphoma chrysanthemicola]|nr:hypothetical protein BKA63DRAFT_555928 [Paraphoma chrysanthemicola]